MKASPDDFVVLVPSTFEKRSRPYITSTHIESWQETLSIEDVDENTLRISLPEGSIDVALDPPIAELATYAAGSLEPFGGSDLILLQNHTVVWRLMASGPFSAWPIIRLVSTLTEAGASAAFLPATRRLHSPRAVQRFAMDAAPDAIANFFVSAFDGDGWMRTRGLTPFRLPEVETEITNGHNAAYFRLMDLAAAMIARGRPFEDGAEITMGPHSHRVALGPNSPLSDEVEVNGIHGVLTLR
jgi:hypothetical protein